MRLSRDQLYKLTGFKRRSAQVDWFINHFGAEPASDRYGPVVSAQIIELLMLKKLGLKQPASEELKPAVRLRIKEEK